MVESDQIIDNLTDDWFFPDQLVQYQRSNHDPDPDPMVTLFAAAQAKLSWLLLLEMLLADQRP